MKKRVLLEDIQGNEIYPRPGLPVGFVIFLSNALDPNIYFMGTWQKIEEEVFFMTASSDFPVGQVSGSNEHTLTIDEMPRHAHNLGTSLENSSGPYKVALNGQGYSNDVQVKSSVTGGGKSFDVRPRRYTVNAWVRIS